MLDQIQFDEVIDEEFPSCQIRISPFVQDPSQRHPVGERLHPQPFGVKPDLSPANDPVVDLNPICAQGLEFAIGKAFC
jgi:hypothetical protein